MIKDERRLFWNICTFHFIVRVWKGLLMVLLWEGVRDRTELQYFYPHSYGRQRCVFLVLQGCSTGGPGAQLSAGWWLSLLHLITNWSPKLHWGPEGRFSRVWLSLPHLVSNFSGPQLNRPCVAFPTTSRPLLQLSDLLSWLSYIIVQSPLNHPLNLWNGMFDRHQAEITIMQFTGHSFPVHHSVAAQWDLHLVAYYQPSSPVRFLSINGHWDVSLPLSLEWHVCPGLRSKYNIKWYNLKICVPE